MPLTNLDKVLFPAATVTPRGDQARPDPLLRLMAPVLLPYLDERPVNLHRFPDGVDRPGFWHKAVPSHAPEWIRRWRYDDARPGRDGVVHRARQRARAGLAGELRRGRAAPVDVTHPRRRSPDLRADRHRSRAVVVVRRRRRARPAVPHRARPPRRSSAGRRSPASAASRSGCPIAPGCRRSTRPGRGWRRSRARSAQTVPELVSWAWHKGDRKGLARLDYTQNAINKTLVAPYSVRAAPGAPVSAPIEWDELDDADLRPDQWTIRDLPARVAKIGDLFAPVLEVEQHLPSL